MRCGRMFEASSMSRRATQDPRRQLAPLDSPAFQRSSWHTNPRPTHVYYPPYQARHTNSPLPDSFPPAQFRYSRHQMCHQSKPSQNHNWHRNSSNTSRRICPPREKLTSPARVQHTPTLPRWAADHQPIRNSYVPGTNPRTPLADQGR